MPPRWTAMPCGPPISRRLPATLAVIGQAAARAIRSPAASDRARPCASSPAPPLPSGADADRHPGGRRPRRQPASVVREGHRPRAATSAPRVSISAPAMLCSSPGRRIGPREVSLAAAMGYGELPVRRRPRIAIARNRRRAGAAGRPSAPGQIIVLQPSGRGGARGERR